jgi:hypothetical protein
MVTSYAEVIRSCFKKSLVTELSSWSGAMRELEILASKLFILGTTSSTQNCLSGSWKLEATLGVTH